MTRRFDWLADPLLHLFLIAVAIAGIAGWRYSIRPRDGDPWGPGPVVTTDQIERELAPWTDEASEPWART